MFLDAQLKLEVYRNNLDPKYGMKGVFTSIKCFLGENYVGAGHNSKGTA